MRTTFKTLLVIVMAISSAVYSAAQTADEAVPDPRMERINESLQTGELDAAVQELEAMAAEKELSPPLLGLLGALYVEVGDPGKGLEILTPLAQDANADPAVLYNAGRAAFNLGDYSTAESLLQRSLEHSPRSPAVRELGIIRAQEGRFRDAYVLLRPWLAANPDDLDAKMVGALCAVQLKRTGEAEALLADLDSSNPKVQLLTGRMQLDKGDPRAAIATLEPLAKSPPPDLATDLYRTLAAAHIAVGQSAEAIQLLEGLASKDAMIALQLAKAQYQGGDLDGAISSLAPFAELSLSQLAAEDSPPGGESQVKIVSEYGRLLATGGRAEEAIPYLEAATRLEPDEKQSWQHLGQAYAASGRREEARTALQRFQEIVSSEVSGAAKDLQIEADIDDPTGRVLREARKTFAEGRVDEAITSLYEEAQLTSGDPRPMLLAAQFLLLSERADESLALADQILQMYPNLADGHYIKGTILMGMMHLPEAEAEYRRTLDLAPEHTAAMSDLAVLMMEQDRNAEARELLERVLEVRPGDPLATSNLDSLGPP